MSFKSESLEWDDLKMFLLVARAGGLSGAVAGAGTSSPTLSRRMANLEATLNTRLFIRRQTGFELTHAGMDLLARAEQMEEGYRQILEWSQQKDSQPVVKITAGHWTCMFIARHLKKLNSGEIKFDIELLSGKEFLNVSRREADIAIRNKMPNQQGLVRRRIGMVNFAIYGSKEYVKAMPKAKSAERFKNCDWISFAETASTGASTLWLARHLENKAKVICSSPQIVLESVLGGSGLTVLPDFIGSAHPDLVACSDFIKELAHTQWMVLQDDGRKQPQVKQAVQNLVEIFEGCSR